MSSVIQIRLIDGITYANEVKLKQQWQQKIPLQDLFWWNFPAYHVTKIFCEMLVEEETKISRFLQIKLMGSVIQIGFIDSITYAKQVNLKQQWQQRFPLNPLSPKI